MQNVGFSRIAVACTAGELVIDLAKISLGLRSIEHLWLLLAVITICHSFLSTHIHNPNPKTLRPCTASLAQLGRRPDAILRVLWGMFALRMRRSGTNTTSGFRSDHAIRSGMIQTYIVTKSWLKRDFRDFEPYFHYACAEMARIHVSLPKSVEI